MVKVDNFIKLYTVIALNSGHRNGYSLMKELENKLDRKISAAHIYPFLKELNQNNYVSFKQNGKGKIYKLTRSGSKFASQLLFKFHGIIQESLKDKLTACTHCGCEVYNNKYTEIVNGKKLAFCCCHCADSYKKGIKHG